VITCGPDLRQFNFVRLDFFFFFFFFFFFLEVIDLIRTKTDFNNYNT
jgi:hypothetical protein